MICDKCNGETWIKTSQPDLRFKCNKYWGKPELDWIENIFGVESSDMFWFSSSTLRLRIKK